MKPSKPLKPAKQVHTANTKYGMGDYYGTGVRNPMGRMRDGFGEYPATESQLKKPPKSLA
jgi:hypothetical protein